MLNAYPFILAAGALLGLLWLGLVPGSERDQETEAAGRIDAGLVALLGGLIGARLGYVAAYWGYYSSQVAEIAQLWEGGLSWHGAALGSLLGLAVYSAATRRDWWGDLDTLAIPALIVGAAAWFGCLLDACAYGLRTAAGPVLPDILGVEASRWPTQTVGGILSVIAIAALLRVSRRDLRSGFLACSSLTMLAAISLLLAFTRGDAPLVVAGLRADGIASGTLTVIGIAGMVMRR